MNILILQASPRKNGNTAWMAEEYKKAAEAAGHQATIVDVAHKKIAGCLACEYCHTKGNGACIQKDDMQDLYPLMAEAEVLVLAAPIYYFALNAQLGVYESAKAEYRDLCGFWGATDTGTVTAMATEQKTDETKAKIAALVGNL